MCGGDGEKTRIVKLSNVTLRAFYTGGPDGGFGLSRSARHASAILRWCSAHKSSTDARPLVLVRLASGR
jgi:hypothetical protein